MTLSGACYFYTEIVYSEHANIISTECMYTEIIIIILIIVIIITIITIHGYVYIIYIEVSALISLEELALLAIIIIIIIKCCHSATAIDYAPTIIIGEAVYI